jgi:hypothetical protein
MSQTDNTNINTIPNSTDMFLKLLEQENAEN